MRFVNSLVRRPFREATMSIRKQLIKLNNKLESTWNLVDFSEPTLKGGWYIAEFTLDGLIDHLPEILSSDL